MSLQAFLSADFGWTRQLPSIWNSGSHTQDLNPGVLNAIIEDFERMEDPDVRTLGHVIVGGAGAGKTHLMGALRDAVLEQGQWFILLDFAGITDFWRSTALGCLNSLQQPSVDGKPQFKHCLELLTEKPEFSAFRAAYRSVRQRLTQGEVPTTSKRLELVRLFLESLQRGTGTLAHQPVVRAYLQLLLGDLDIKNCAYAWLQGFEPDPEVLAIAGLPRALSPREVVDGTLWMLGCVGRTLIAVDQIDAIVTEQNLTPSTATPASDAQGRVRSIVQSLAGGLMELYDLSARAKTVLSCLEATWNALQTRVTAPATDRFWEPVVLKPIPSERVAMEVVTSRLSRAYSRLEFAPPYPTWPFQSSAFASALQMAPRTLLKACEAHRSKCRAQGQVVELTSFVSTSVVPATAAPAVNDIESKFIEKRQAAEIAGLTTEADEADLKNLLFDVLTLYADTVEVAEDVDVGVADDKALQRPSLHARLVFTYRGLGDRERHFCYRLIPQVNAIAFQSRLRAAMTASGLDRSLAFRHLIIVRRGSPPSGAKTAELVEQFKSAGGFMVDPSDEDLRTMRALAALKDEPGFKDWLRQERIFAKLSLFSTVRLHELVLLDEASPKPMDLDRSAGQQRLPLKELESGDPPQESRRSPQATSRDAAKSKQTGNGSERARALSNPESIPVGRRIEGGTEGREAAIPVSVIPRHTAILAGAGAGKTVLIRRLIEEAVLRGIPALVLDSNNDLSTLGDRWPEAPKQWGPKDSLTAEKYHSMAEVVIWTPGLSRGRPITLDVLPDFAALTDEDELSQAIDMALHTVASLVKLADIKKGVVADALRAFALQGGRDLDAFIGLLGDLPQDASKIGKAKKVGADVANQLHAAMSTNPLLRGGGDPLDPRTLFTSKRKGRTRISVINFVGLPSDESRQEFVNRLQMALFTWIKREPSERPRLYVIDEARNFIPSGKPAASKESAISLAAQARKYGLGLIVATQTPKDIDNKVVSNCTTHFYGKMNSPAAIDTVKDMMANKGGAASDIGALTSGVFYFSTEGLTQPVKVKTSMCLSYHPPNPPGEPDVVRRAATGLSTI